MTKETYAERRAALREKMPSGGIIMMLGNAEAPRNYPQMYIILDRTARSDTFSVSTCQTLPPQ